MFTQVREISHQKVCAIW